MWSVEKGVECIERGKAKVNLAVGCKDLVPRLSVRLTLDCTVLERPCARLNFPTALKRFRGNAGGITKPSYLDIY